MQNERLKHEMRDNYKLHYSLLFQMSAKHNSGSQNSGNCFGLFFLNPHP